MLNGFTPTDFCLLQITDCYYRRHAGSTDRTRHRYLVCLAAKVALFFLTRRVRFHWDSRFVQRKAPFLTNLPALLLRGAR